MTIDSVTSLQPYVYKNDESKILDGTEITEKRKSAHETYEHWLNGRHQLSTDTNGLGHFALSRPASLDVQNFVDNGAQITTCLECFVRIRTQPIQPV